MQGAQQGPAQDAEVWLKTDIINRLADLQGYRSYVELCTPVTGNCYAKIDRSKFTACRRLMYHCPDGWSDGLDIDFRSSDFDTSDCLRRIEDQRLRFDVVLVDPWHEYATSYRDLTCAFDLLEEYGTIIVHDCLPPDEGVADPHRRPDAWCGVTYKAYLDFVTSRNDLVFCTIDTDYGCGVIRKGRGFGAPRRKITGSDSLVREWQSIGNDLPVAFRFYERNKSVLMNVISVGEFLVAERASARWRLVRRFARRWF